MATNRSCLEEKLTELELVTTNQGKTTTADQSKCSDFFEIVFVV